jgi:nucleotide-binding universal stress UspA family protein
MNNATAIKLLGAIDYKEQSDLVVRQTLEIAQRYPSADVHFLHVSSSSADDVGAGARRSAQLLEWLTLELKQIGGVAPHLRIIGHEAHGEPSATIVHTARELEVDMVVIGTRERGAVERLLGSVSEWVIRHAECPVLLARPKGHEQVGVQIEAACPQCLEARQQSRGAILWCSQHIERHGRRHTYYDNHAQTWTTKPWFWEGVGPSP